MEEGGANGGGQRWGSSRDIWKLYLFPGSCLGFSLLGGRAMGIILAFPWHPAAIAKLLPSDKTAKSGSLLGPWEARGGILSI